MAAASPAQLLLLNAHQQRHQQQQHQYAAGGSIKAAACRPQAEHAECSRSGLRSWQATPEQLPVQYTALSPVTPTPLASVSEILTPQHADDISI